ncbi:MAG: pirin family protein [Enhygromyxa sp.]
MSDSAILGAFELPAKPTPWPTLDPFLFCVHHDDAYPAGDEQLGPQASLAGRKIGMDFEGKDGWRMYHGDVIPGFPRHPHRGFETVTLARRGYIDHSDSLGARARFGHGDCQWMTAGRGIEHSEMFPLLERDAPNPTELFQIWLNLPAADKLVEPHFTMLWSESIPRPKFASETGTGEVEIAVVAGALAEHRGPPPPPSSWASRPEAEVAIWTIKMPPGSRWTIPAASAGLNRTLYFFAGETVQIDGAQLDRHAGVRLRSEAAVELVAGPGPGPIELLLLQGRPIGEPVVQHGPFVMNSQDEIRRAFADYRMGGFGRWPWDSDAPVHGREAGRFAVHADGRQEAAQ